MAEQERHQVSKLLPDRFSHMKSKQFAIWVVTFAVVYSVVAYILMAISLPTQYSLLVGIVLAQPLDRVYKWLGEWYRLEEEVSEYNVE